MNTAYKRFTHMQYTLDITHYDKILGIIFSFRSGGKNNRDKYSLDKHIFYAFFQRDHTQKYLQKLLYLIYLSTCHIYAK